MKRTIFGVLCTAVTALATSTSPCFARDFYGLMDKTGKFVVPANYREIKQQNDGTYAVTAFGEEGGSNEDIFVLDKNGQRLPDRKPAPAQSNALMFTTAPRLDYEVVRSHDENIGSLYGLRNKKTGRMSIPFRSIKELLPYPVGDDLFIDQKQIGDKTETLLLEEGGTVIAKIPNLLSSPNLEFIDGVMIAENVDREYGFFDKRGRLVGNRYFEVAERFADGVAAVRFRQDGILYGAWIDKNGGYVYGPKKNTIVGTFFDGIASLEAFESEQSLAGTRLKSIGRGIVNRKFEVIIPVEYDYIRQLDKRLVAKVLATRGGGWVVFDFDGNKLSEVISSTNEICPSDDCELVAFTESTDANSTVAIASSVKWGFVNLAGKVIVPPKFDEAMAFSDGVAVVSVKDKNATLQSGTIDAKGKFIVQPKFKHIIPTKPLEIVVDVRDGGFDPYAWANPDLRGFLNRYEQWHAFLREYDLIGMERKKIFRLLGDDHVLHSRGRLSPTLPESDVLPTNGIMTSAKSVFYGLNSSICGHASSSLEIEFGDDDKVSRYRILRGGEPTNDQPWVLENKHISESRSDQRIQQ